MNLKIITTSKNFILTLPSEKDVDDLVKHLSNPEVTSTTLTIPHPYTREHAEKFIRAIPKSTYQFVIRNRCVDVKNYNASLIGCIGIKIDPIQPHKGTLGYWLAKEFWGQGIMTDVVKTFSEFCFEAFSLKKISATCFEHNVGSARVLEKSGFTLEGLLVKHYYKNNEYINAKLYSKIV